MKTINRYVILDENNITYASFLDKEVASNTCWAANRGLYRRRGWKGIEYKVEERKTLISKATGTFFF